MLLIGIQQSIHLFNSTKTRIQFKFYFDRFFLNEETYEVEPAAAKAKTKSA